MNRFKLIIHLVIVLLFTFSCKTPQEGIKKDIAGKEDSNVIFETGNKRLDHEYIKSGCAVTDSVKNQIADIFSYTDFFHLYLQVKSYYPKYLDHFPCAEKLDKYTTPLFALDREPLEKIDYRSNIESFTLHREIVRNLHKIVDVTKSVDGKYLNVSGIKDTKLFDNSDDELIKQLTDPKTNLKFYSYFDERSGNYHEFFIPLKNYNLIKSYLVVLDKDSKKINKAKVSNFAIAYSAMLHLTSPEVIGKSKVIESRQFSWIDEISSTPYYSAIHPLNRFVAKDYVINDPLLAIGYGYPSRLFKSHILLARALTETNILPKNFSIIPAIEKSLKSGNREYCGTIASSNPEGLLIVEKLQDGKLKVSKTYMKHCFSKKGLGIRSGSMQAVNNKRFVNL